MSENRECSKQKIAVNIECIKQTEKYYKNGWRISDGSKSISNSR